jgi:hypothetical protein
VRLIEQLTSKTAAQRMLADPRAEIPLSGAGQEVWAECGGQVDGWAAWRPWPGARPDKRASGLVQDGKRPPNDTLAVVRAPGAGLKTRRQCPPQACVSSYLAPPASHRARQTHPAALGYQSALPEGHRR